MAKLIVDVSSHQNTVDFNKMKKAGVKAVLIRAGYRTAKAGKIQSDPKFAENIRKAEKAGLPIGLYWWTTSLSVKEAVAEANALVNLAQNHKLSFPLWLDLEYYNSKREGRADHLSAAARTTYALAFLERVKKLGFEAGIYCNPDFWSGALVPAGIQHYPRWIAHYGAKSAGMECDIWQYTSTARGADYGAGSRFIDLNHMYTDFPSGAKSKFVEKPVKPSATGNPYREPAVTVTSDAQAKAKGIKTWSSSGEDVKWFQYELKRLGYDLGKSGIDGQCGPKTTDAIGAAQKDFGLTVDKLGGPKTRAALKAAKERHKAKKPDHTVSVNGKKVTIHGKTLEVFNQHKLKGDYHKELSSSGCGASCTTFALMLNGVSTTPAAVLKKGIKLWGKWPRACLLAAPGIATVIKAFGCPAKYHSTTDLEAAKKTIDAALKAGKQVVVWTNDNGLKGDPFSGGHHYVLAVGYDKTGKVVVANSGNKGPVNIVSLDTLVKFLQKGSGEDKTWWKAVSDAAGIVVVG